jgi:small subunit ribosomal protein S1
MSDTDKPSPPPSNPQQPAAEERAPHERPPIEQGRPRPQRERPGRSGAPVRSLEHEVTYGAGRKIDAFDAEMERQLEEAMGGASSKDLLDAPPGGKGPPQPKRGSGSGVQIGKVHHVHGKDVFVEVPGGRTQGVLPMEQFPEGPPAPGTEVEIHIEGYDRDGVLLLTRKGSAVAADWSSVAAGMTVEARVTTTNKGGLAVEVNGIRGFMPISQIDLYRVDNPEQFVGQKLLCLVTEVDREEKNLVLSRRALLEKERDENRDKLWAELAEGQVREGVVRSVRDFGAFVDLGGVDGLLHVSQLSWQRVNDPSSVVQPGQTVRVVILKIDPDTRKLSLGMKQLLGNPWDEVATNYPPGIVVKGKVVKLMEFGAFVELEPGVEGLVHISELAPQRVRAVREVVQTGQEVQVKVLSVDKVQQRIALSIKAALAAPEPKEEEEDEAEEEVKPRRPRTTPLRGGVGNQVKLPLPPSES